MFPLLPPQKPRHVCLKCSDSFTSSLWVSGMETFSNTLNYEQAPGSPCFLQTVSNRLYWLYLVSYFSFLFFFSTNFVYWSNSCFAAAKKNVPNCKDFICFKRPHIRGKRHEQDLISRTLSHCRSSEILLCFFAGASCDILVQRAAHWLQGFERRRGGQGRIATSGTTQPLKRDLMLEWALRIGLESFLSVCLCGGQCSMCLWEREKIGGERQKGRDGKRGRKGVLK